MKCNLKSMAALAAALLAALAVAYLAFPATQTFVLASAPLLVALICPVTLIVMMWTMRGHGSHVTQVAPKAELLPMRGTSDLVHEA